MNVNKWFFLDGNSKFLEKHKLDEQSIVFEVWWYTGVFSDKIAILYNPYIYIFEPVQEYYDILISKYSTNPKIKVFHFWLSDSDSALYIAKSNDGTSVFKHEWQQEEIFLRDIFEFLKTEKLDTKKIDLISINIEGWEYQLLDRILDKTPDIFLNIQVQFHDFVDSAVHKRNAILQKLEKSNYIPGYSFPFVWELFSKK
jgi:FkbM family methyltransferase